MRRDLPSRDDRGCPLRMTGFVLALAAWALGGSVAAQVRSVQLPSPEARKLLLEHHGRADLRDGGAPAVDGLQSDYDVLHYDISVLLDAQLSRVAGSCTIRLRSLVSSLGVIELDLHAPEYQVSRVQRLDRPGALVEIAHDGDKLLLELVGERPGPDDEVVLRIQYSGRPRELPGRSPAVSFERGAVGDLPRAHSFAEPNNARGWFPCKDRPDDKATLDLRVEAPVSMTVVGNGLLQSTAPGRDGFRVSHWRHEHPIATYLIAFSAGTFVTWNEPWDWVDAAGDGQQMTVSYWAWPELTGWAYQDFANTVPMLDALSERFGAYPFADEKYGLVLFGEDGGMEHQTATGIGGSVIALSRGTGAVENLLVHELAHHWWGNSVGITDFESVWLKEGFSTWSEALWWEENGGLAAYLEYMEDLDRPFGRAEFQGTVHAPSEAFGSTVYYKGAWVMHMLRFVLSGPAPSGEPDAIFDLLRAWASERAGGTASTAEFVEFASRESLDGSVGPGPLSEWFFPQWLEREGRPRYAIDSASHREESGFGWTTHVRVEQRQAGEPYAMPVHVRLHGENGSVTDEIYFVGSQVEDYSTWTDEPVVSVELDPLGWLLKDEVESTEIDRDGDGWPDWLDSCPDVPDPEQIDENENAVGDACEEGLDFDGDGWPNEFDCAAADGDVWTQPKGDTLLRVEHEGPSTIRLLLEHPPPEGQRPYRADIALGSLTLLHQHRSMESVICLIEDFEGEVYEDFISFGPLGTYWVAMPNNGCPPLPPPLGRRNPCP
jgi:aminopeptidase N